MGQTVIAPYMKDANKPYLVYNERYRDEIWQRRVWGADASSYKI